MAPLTPFFLLRRCRCLSDACVTRLRAGSANAVVNGSSMRINYVIHLVKVDKLLSVESSCLLQRSRTHHAIRFSFRSLVVKRPIAETFLKRK